MTRPQRLSIASAALTALLAVCPGCGSNEPMSASAAGTSGAPTFSEINQALKLDQADAAIVKSALAEWTRGANAQKAGARGFAGGRQQMEFIAAVTPSLDDEQLSSLVSVLLAQRDDQRDQMRAHHRGMRGDGERMARLSKQLGLTARQQDELRVLLTETRAKAAAQRKSFAGGGVDEDQLRAALQRIHEDARTEMETILTADQMKKFDALRDERFENRMGRRVEHASDRNDNHLAWLVRTLELNDAQASQVRTAQTTLRDAQAATLESVQDGSLTREAAHEKMRSARDAFQESLKGILNAEQGRRFDILQPLVPGRDHHA